MLVLLLPFLLGPGAVEQQPTIADRFMPPPGFERAIEVPNSFGAWCRELKVLPKDAPVMLHNGRLKGRQDVHAAVLDISVGRKDLQQCADAIMRLRAEYLFASGRASSIAFHFTNGFLARFDRWSNGERIQVNGNTCSWARGGTADNSHNALMAFMERVFMYAGTLSLGRELRTVEPNAPVRIGEVFIHPGSPGHAMLVVDVAIHRDGRRAFLLAQSYMPAQQIHVVMNHGEPNLGAWYIADHLDRLHTPEWTFNWDERMTWPNLE